MRGQNLVITDTPMKEKSRNKTPGLFILAIVLLFVLSSSLAFSQTKGRFPKPDFQTEYSRPDLQTPSPRSQSKEYIDMAVLFIVLVLASYFALKLRSRRKIFILMLFCLIYFGFIRKGCVCSIGAIQNVGYAFSHLEYAIPLSIIIFFALPLLFTLFFGRTFCAAVCPLGGIQDVVIIRPTPIPEWLSHILGLFPYIYLSLALLFASTGAGFIICQYDPFIGFFRFGASFNMIIFGLSILLLGTVIARPYCRFLCPYGVLLNWMSHLSKYHVKITPTECNNCRLCEKSCPFGSIKKPSGPIPREDKTIEIKRLAYLLIFLPIIIFLTSWSGSKISQPLSFQHPTVALSKQIVLENSLIRTEMTDETRAFRASGKPLSELMKEAQSIQHSFIIGGWFMGGFIGLILCLKLIGLTIRRKNSEYVIEKGGCLSCARCFSYCPYEQVRLGIITPEELKEMESSTKLI